MPEDFVSNLFLLPQVQIMGVEKQSSRPLGLAFIVLTE